jgi:hypothetical protein
MRDLLPSAWQLTSCSTPGAGTESTMSHAVTGHGPSSWSQAEAGSAGALVEAHAETRRGRPRAGTSTFIMSMSSSSAMSATEPAMGSSQAATTRGESLSYSGTVRYCAGRMRPEAAPATLPWVGCAPLPRSRARPPPPFLPQPPVLVAPRRFLPRFNRLERMAQDGGRGRGFLPHKERG